MSWASLIVGGLKVLLSVMTYLNERKLIQAGEDKAIAQMALQLVERTEHGKALREQVKAMTPTEEQDLWDRMTKQ